MLGLPENIKACLFDLDGVLTRTSVAHAEAWTTAFDDFLRRRAAQTGEPFVAFDPETDYPTYVDGKLRSDGVRDFLASRGITLPEGAADDSPEMATVRGLGNYKNQLLLARIESGGVEVYDDSRRYAEAARNAGLGVAVVSSSANTERILAVTGLATLVTVRVDGVVARELSLPGKPSPATFLHAAEELAVAPSDAAVFEDALAGVAAGRAGGFGFVVGVDRLDQATALAEHGADVVVGGLGELW